MKIFDRQKIYIINLCKTRNARRNLDAAKNAQNRIGHEKLLWQYHKEHLERHIETTDKLLEIFNAGRLYDHDYETNKVAPLNHEAPYFQSDIYSPFTAYKDIRHSGCRITLDGREITVLHSNLLKGVDGIEMETDNYYKVNDCYLHYFRERDDEMKTFYSEFCKACSNYRL
jgi:hypothetical protein